MQLEILADTFAVCRLAHSAAIPNWATGDFVSVSRCADELSIVCPQDHVPQHVAAEREWRCLRIVGPLDFSEVGVLASLAAPLADAKIPIFVISTFTTDYLLVRIDDQEHAFNVLRETGNELLTQNP